MVTQQAKAEGVPAKTAQAAIATGHYYCSGRLAAYPNLNLHYRHGSMVAQSIAI